MAFTTFQRPTAAQLNATIGRPIARGRRTTTSSASTSTTDIGVLRLDDIPLISGALYLITSAPLALDSSVTNDEIGARIRYTTDGSTPSVSSTILPGSPVSLRQTDNNVPEHRTIVTTYTPASTETLSLLLCVRRIAGTGNAVIFADGTDITEIVVWQYDQDPGDTGTDI